MHFESLPKPKTSEELQAENEKLEKQVKKLRTKLETQKSLYRQCHERPQFEETTAKIAKDRVAELEKKVQ